MDFRKKYLTSNLTKGENSCEYIILHHTATGAGTSQSVINRFITKGSGVSCHFVIDVNGDKYKIGNPEDILWHTGLSSWKGKKDEYNSMNAYSIGIEVIGPLSYGFDDRQRKSVKELMIHLMQVYGIKKENILRHKDIAPGRKVDIDDRFWYPEFKSWDSWKDAKLNS